MAFFELLMTWVIGFNPYETTSWAIYLVHLRFEILMKISCSSFFWTAIKWINWYR
jgi:hypothetical protein